MPIRIAMAQMLVEGGRLDANLGRAHDAIAEAKRHGAAVVVLPECLDVGWLDESASVLATPVPGPTTDFFSTAAREHGITVVAGLTERNGERLHNAAVVIGPDGALLRTHRKVNELDFAQALYTTGDEVGVAVTPFGRVGLAICADLAPGVVSMGHTLGHMRAQVILSPTSWAVPPDHDNAREPYGSMWRDSYTRIAQRFGVAVIGVSNVGTVRHGPWTDWRCIGCSLAIGSDGNVLAQGPYGVDAEALLYTDVELPQLHSGHW